MTRKLGGAGRRPNKRRERVPVLVISLKLKRSIASIHAKLAEVGLTAPANA